MEGREKHEDKVKAQANTDTSQQRQKRVLEYTRITMTRMNIHIHTSHLSDTCNANLMDANSSMTIPRHHQQCFHSAKAAATLC